MYRNNINNDKQKAFIISCSFQFNNCPHFLQCVLFGARGYGINFPLRVSLIAIKQCTPTLVSHLMCYNVSHNYTPCIVIDQLKLEQCPHGYVAEFGTL